MATLLNVTSQLSGLSLSEGIEVTKVLVIYIIAIVVYAVFIFKFYRFLGKRDIFELNLRQYSESFFGFLATIISTILYLVEYVILFPLFAFFWFAIISLLLMFMTRNQSIEIVLMMSMALVAAIRITAYYNEDLSKDLAKMIPFALLGVFLVDMSFFDPASSLELLKQIPSMWLTAIYYLIMFIIIEFVLRMVALIMMVLFPKMEAAREAAKKN